MKKDFNRDFEEWFKKQGSNYEDILSFNKLPIEMQFGVFQLFADSVFYEWLEIEATSNWDSTIWYMNANDVNGECFKNRSEAMKEAIKIFKEDYEK